MLVTFWHSILPNKRSARDRHHHIASDSPAVTAMRFPPFVDEYFCNFFRCQNRSSIESAGGEKINRPINPYSFEPTQVLMHSPSVAKIGDPDEPLISALATRPGSPIPA